MGRKTTRDVETLYRTVESSSREATEELVESPL
jgi:hypothetical protein